MFPNSLNRLNKMYEIRKSRIQKSNNTKKQYDLYFNRVFHLDIYINRNGYLSSSDIERLVSY